MNFAGIAVVVLLASVPGVLEPKALHVAGGLADTLAGRDLASVVASAVLAGAVITMFTWLAEAAESDLTPVVIALAVGFVLLAPSANHSVIGFGEILLGLVTGTTSADGIDLLRNTAVAISGSVAGGVVLVAFVRSVQP